MICLVGIQTRSIISARISDLSVRKDVKKLATWGAIVFISGFGIWNLNNALCGALTGAKRAVGMPWSFVLELHGWWHVFTGVGAYICLCFPSWHIAARMWGVLMLIDCRYCSRGVFNLG
jgi:dihydroceramidase